MWTGMRAQNLKTLFSLPTYPKTPVASYTIEQFSTPRDLNLRYGQRLYGYFLPPETGNYIFAASCTDECKLYLSKNDEEAKREEIIKHEAGSVQDQSSEPVLLKGGHTYFIEAVSIHDDNDAPMKVGVRIPSGRILAPVPNEMLRLERGALVDEEFNTISGTKVRDLLTTRDFPETPTKATSLTDFSINQFEEPGNHGHRVSGYFLATETGKFKFFGSCASGCRLYLSDDDTCNKRSLVFESKPPFQNHKREQIGNLTTRGLDLPSLFEVSKTFDLEAGLYYYIEALQAVVGDKQNSLKMGVVQPSGKTNFPVKKDLLCQFSPSKHGVVRELWKNVPGENIRDITNVVNFPNIPAEVKLLQDFDAPFNERYNYGQRLKSYFVAPMTGDYRFVMACDRRCELWMSPTEHAAHKKRVLRQTRLTARHQFDRYPEEQISEPIHLDIGQQYYLEAVHKAATGLDHLSVGVTLPTGANEWPIPKKYLRFRPKEKKESRIRVPCNYDLDEAVNSTVAHASAASKVLSKWEKLHGEQGGTVGETKTIAGPIKLKPGETSPNDVSAILGSNDEIELEKSTKPLQHKNELFDEGVDDDDTTVATLHPDEKLDAAHQKVKVTHIDMSDEKDATSEEEAKDAMSLLQNITKDGNNNMRIHPHPKGTGFTITGLPESLSSADVTKIAHGVASFMNKADEKKAAPTPEKMAASITPDAAKPDEIGSTKADKSPAPEKVPEKGPGPDKLASETPKKEAEKERPVFDVPADELSKAVADLEKGHPAAVAQMTQNKLLGGINTAHLANGANLALALDPTPVPVVPPGTVVASGGVAVAANAKPVVIEAPKGVYAGSLNVIGNLAAAAASGKPQIPTEGYTTAAISAMGPIGLPNSGSGVHHPLAGAATTTSLGDAMGDSIGGVPFKGAVTSPLMGMTPESHAAAATAAVASHAANNMFTPYDMTTATAADFSPALEGNGAPAMGEPAGHLVANPPEPPAPGPQVTSSGRFKEMPINRITDYDILDVDLDGLKSMNPSLGASLAGSSASDKLSGSEVVPNGMSEATFVGDQLNAEANEFDNYLTLKKKKIPRKMSKKSKVKSKREKVEHDPTKLIDEKQKRQVKNTNAVSRSSFLWGRRKTVYDRKRYKYNKMT